MSDVNDKLKNRLALNEAQADGSWILVNALIEQRVLHGWPLGSEDHLIDSMTGEPLDPEVEARLFRSYMQTRDELGL